MAMDEARLGLISWHKRRYRHKGERPSWVVRRRYEWSWLYTAIEPTSGEDFCLYLSALDGVCFEVFLQHLGERFAGEQDLPALFGVASVTGLISSEGQETPVRIAFFAHCRA